MGRGANLKVHDSPRARGLCGEKLCFNSALGAAAGGKLAGAGRTALSCLGQEPQQKDLTKKGCFPSESKKSVIQ